MNIIGIMQALQNLRPEEIVNLYRGLEESIRRLTTQVDHLERRLRAMQEEVLS